MIVYHGGLEIIKKTDVAHSYRRLDFGKGFYVTTVGVQAEKWARRKADILDKRVAMVNQYALCENIGDFKVKTIQEDLGDWIDFVCACRDGKTEYAQYDIIIGRVADDKVFRVVDMYHQGIWDRERALKEMKVYKAYDQICFVSQSALDKLLQFEAAYEVC